MFCIFAVGDRWLVSPKRVLKASGGKQDDFTLHSYASAATAICFQYQSQKEIEYYKMTCRTIQNKSIEGLCVFLTHFLIMLAEPHFF